MASTYVNDLRLNEMATGDGSGTWGTTTNTNLELIAEAFSYGTEVITTNADTHTTTIADGATDPGRSLYLKYTGTLDSACTITIGPNTVSKVWIIENGTSGSQNIIISQGSGANITIPAGDTKVVYSDGAGAGAAFVDAFASLSVVDLKVQDDLTVTDAALVTGVLTTTATQVATGGITSGSDIISDTDSTDSLGSTGVRWLKGWFDTLTAGTLTVGSGSVTDSSGAISFGDENLTTTGIVTAAGTSVFTNLDISGDIDVDGTTNLDVVDIDGALTQDGGAVFNEASADVDFRVESDNDANALFVQGSDGYVGIGTGGPAAKLHATGTFGTTLTSGVRLDGLGTTTNNVAPIAFYNQSSNWGTQHAANIAAANADGTDGGAYLRFSTSADGNTAPAERMRIPNDSSGIYAITSNNERAGGIANASSAQNALRVWADPDDERSSSRIEFYVDVGEAMRIESNHSVLVGTTSIPTGGASTGFSISDNGGLQMVTHGVSGTTNTYVNIYKNANGTVGGIRVSGSATAYDTASDYRLKENVVTDWDATTRLKQLRPSRFNFIADADTTVDGFLAHEVQDIVPEAISGTKDAMRDEEYEVTPAALDDDGNVVTEAVMGTRSVPDYQGIDQSKLVPLLVKTIQELEARITTLENA
jgi:hypothetical protein